MNRSIPGYFWDEEKKKYFKIESSHTAPTDARWSVDNVKRRKLEDRAAEKARKVLTRREGLIKRAKVLEVPLMGGFFVRELGTGKPSSDVPIAGFASGLQYKGRISFSPGSEPGSGAANLPTFFIGGQDTKSGLGVAYTSMYLVMEGQPDTMNIRADIEQASPQEDYILTSYIPRDDNDVISFKEASSNSRFSRYLVQQRAEMLHIPQISRLVYHETTHKMLVTSRREDTTTGVALFSPALSDDKDVNKPRWLLGEADHYQQFYIEAHQGGQVIHDCKAAPPSSDLICVMTSTAGLLQLRRDEEFRWLYPTADNTARGRRRPRDRIRSETLRMPYARFPAGAERDTDGGGATTINDPVLSTSAPLPHDLLTVDFMPHNHNLLLLGSRSGHLWLADTRAPYTQWSWWAARPRHASVTHVAAVNEYHVLAAGLRNSMALYDVRFCNARTIESSSTEDKSDIGGSTNRKQGGGGGGHKETARPLLVFQGYNNAAHLDLGFAVEQQLGIAAAAHDDGTVALYSLKTGRRLRSRRVDEIKATRPVKCLAFESLPGDRNPSLFAGIGPSVHKYSFGLDHHDEEWGL